MGAFIVPCAGKMLRSNVAKDNRALCFVINKGYIELNNLSEMLEIRSAFLMLKDVVAVGGIEKVKLQVKGVVYRQRIFFKSLSVILVACQMLGLRFELEESFRISINNIMNCIDELVYMERYARVYDETIDEWLTHCCVIELYILLSSFKLKSNLSARVNRYLDGKWHYLHRAPFLISSYNLEKKISGIFLDFSSTDERLYEKEVSGVGLLEYGYTDENIRKDIKSGALK